MSGDKYTDTTAVAPSGNPSLEAAEAGEAMPQVIAPTEKGVHADHHPEGLMLPLLSAILAGILFGIALHKAGVFQIDVIRDQFLLKNWRMLKIFLTGAASSVLAMTLLRKFSTLGKEMAEEASMAYRTCSVGVPATLLGATLLGIGMAISGSCPGTIYIQLGALMRKALFTFLGLVLGSLVYGLLVPEMKRFLRWKPTPEGKHTVYELFNVSHFVMGLIITAGMAGALVLLEVLSPDEMGTFSGQFWHPILAGLLIGVLQIPLTLSLQKNAGASSTYVTLLANLLYPVMKSHPRYAFFDSKRTTMKNWWQVIYGAGAVVGSFIVLSIANASAYNPPDSQLVWFEGIIGGFLCAFGARMAGGCTSGHGMSGVGHQVARSYGAVGCMLAGGIATSFLLYN